MQTLNIFRIIISSIILTNIRAYSGCPNTRAYSGYPNTRVYSGYPNTRAYSGYPNLMSLVTLKDFS